MAYGDTDSYSEFLSSHPRSCLVRPREVVLYTPGNVLWACTRQLVLSGSCPVGLHRPTCPVGKATCSSLFPCPREVVSLRPGSCPVGLYSPTCPHRKLSCTSVPANMSCWKSDAFLIVSLPPRSCLFGKLSWRPVPANLSTWELVL